MAKDAIVMAMANPIPEIMPDIAKKQGQELFVQAVRILTIRLTTY